MENLAMPAWPCWIPACAGEYHIDGTCVAQLPEVELDVDTDIVVASELLSEDGAPRAS